MADEQLPTIGRTVMYVLPKGVHQGRTRSATVVDVLGIEGTRCELMIFLGSADLGRSTDADAQFSGSAVLRDAHGNALFMRVQAERGGRDELGRWHWPTRFA